MDEAIPLKIEWSSRSEQNLADIIDYLTNEWSINVAEKFKIKVANKINTLSQFPNLGHQAKKNKNVQQFAITKHSILCYHVLENTIYILSVADTRQDPNKAPF